MLSVFMLFSSCVTTQIATRIASVHTKQDLLSEFGYPHNYVDIPQGQVWEYHNLRGDLYARYWIDTNGKIYYKATHGVEERTLSAVGWVIFLGGCLAAGFALGG